MDFYMCISYLNHYYLLDVTLLAQYLLRLLAQRLHLEENIIFCQDNIYKLQELIIKVFQEKIRITEHESGFKRVLKSSLF